MVMFNSNVYNGSTYCGGYTHSIRLKQLWSYYSSIDNLTVMQRFMLTSISFSSSLRRVVRSRLRRTVTLLFSIKKTATKRFLSGFSYSLTSLNRSVHQVISVTLGIKSNVVNSKLMFRAISTLVSYATNILSLGYITPRIIGHVKNKGNLIGSIKDTGLLKGRLKRR